MKKYSDEHLESIEPEFIYAFEETIELIKNGHQARSWSTCPAFILGFGAGYCNYTIIRWCPDNFIYTPKECPCTQFGSEWTIKNGENLISQWKKWAGIDE